MSIASRPRKMVNIMTIYAYLVRHAADPQPNPKIPNEALELHPHGAEFAKNVMGPALRKDIDAIIAAHPGQDYSIEVFHGTTKRMGQTKDEILKSFDGLKNVTVIEEPRLKARDMGEFYGLSDDEIIKRWPGYGPSYVQARQMDELCEDFRTIIKPVGKTAESERDVMKRVGEFQQEQGLETLLSDKPLPPLQIKIYVTSGLPALELRRAFTLSSLGDVHGCREHIEGSIFKLRGEGQMITMEPEGFICTGQRGQTPPTSRRAR